MDFGDKSNSKGIVNNKERNFHAESPRNSKLKVGKRSYVLQLNTLRIVRFPR